MKYKIGDKVKIRSWNSMKKEFGISRGNINTIIVFVSPMKKYCNKIITIKNVYGSYYKMVEYGCRWSEDMIDHRATKIISIIDRLEMLKKLTDDSVVEITIDGRIRVLKSNSPFFNKFDVDYYNNIFRRIKKQKKLDK